MKLTSAVAGEEAMRLPMGKSFDRRFEIQPMPDVKIVLHECRLGEVKVWQAAVAEGWSFRGADSAAARSVWEPIQRTR